MSRGASFRGRRSDRLSIEHHDELRQARLDLVGVSAEGTLASLEMARGQYPRIAHCLAVWKSRAIRLFNPFTVWKRFSDRSRRKNAIRRDFP